MCTPTEQDLMDTYPVYNSEDLDYINPRFQNCSGSDGQGGFVDTASSSPSEPLNYYYLPESDSLYSTVKWGFLLHVYGFGCLFFFLAFYAFFSILNLRSQLSTRPYMSTINSFLCLLGASRAAVLFIDPYGLKKTLPILMGTLLWDLGFPCLISSFSLIQIAFLQLTQLEVGPEKLRKKTCLSIIITVHFVAVIGTAIYSNINSDLVIVKFLFQLGFGLWGLLLCGSFLYAGKKVLGLLGGFNSSNTTSSVGLTTVNEKGVAGLMMAGMMAPGQNLASSLTAALAPTLLQSSTPKIKITDENEQTVSVASNDTTTDSQSVPVRPLTPVPGPSSSVIITGTKQATVRPPSPVLPRKKSGGSTTALRNPNGSGPVRKKSLTWSENEKESGAVGEGSSGNISTNLSINSGVPGSSGSSSAPDKRRGSKKSMDNTAPANSSSESNLDRSGESLLMSSGTGGGPDYTLQSILSHIAYVNQTALDYRLSRKLSRKNQVHKVIKFTSITAILGVFLCIGEIIRILSPFGLFVSTLGPPGPWPWFTLQTFCRLIEFGMGATVANITKQPVNRPPHAYAFRHKHQRDSLYL